VIRDQRSPDSDPHARFTEEEYRTALRLTLEWVEEGHRDIPASLSYVRVWGSSQQLRDNLDLLSELEKRLPQGLKDPLFPPVGGRLALLSRGEPLRPVRQALEKALSMAQDCEVFLEKEGWLYDAATRKLKLISDSRGQPRQYFASQVQRQYRLLTGEDSLKASEPGRPGKLSAPVEGDESEKPPQPPAPFPPGNNGPVREQIASDLQVDFSPDLLGTKGSDRIGRQFNPNALNAACRMSP
jgi:hypothetical protein